MTAGNQDAGAGRPSGMRNRAALVAAVAVFALAVVGLAVVGGGDDDDSSLPKLLYAADAGATDEAGARSASAMLAPAQPTEYRVTGSLPALPEEAPAYRLGGDADEAEGAKLAAALGVEAAAITVPEEPGRPWFYSSTGKDVPLASNAGAATSTMTATARATVRACPPCPPDADCAECRSIEPVPGEPERPADLPTDTEAAAIARGVIAAAGLTRAEVHVRDAFPVWHVTVSPTVDGLPTLGFETTVSVGPKGVIEWAAGYLGSAERLGDYPLVEAEAALERLRNGVGLGPRASGAAEPADLEAPGDPIVVEVTGAHLALQHTAGSLLPVVVFESASGDLVPVPAVTERYLDQQAPADDPLPDPSGEGSGCTVAGRAGSDDGDNAPLTVEVCGPSTAKVGEEVTFEVTVTDPDAPIYTETCEGPWAEFGDGKPTVRTSCAVACRDRRTDDRSPGKHGTAWRYTYEKAGTFTATFHYRSGPCTSGASEGTGKHTIVVN